MTRADWFQAKDRPKGAMASTSRQSRTQLGLSVFQVVVWTSLVGFGTENGFTWLQCVKVAMLALVLVLTFLNLRSYRILKRWEAEQGVDAG